MVGEEKFILISIPVQLSLPILVLSMEWTRLMKNAFEVKVCNSHMNWQCFSEIFQPENIFLLCFDLVLKKKDNSYQKIGKNRRKEYNEGHNESILKVTHVFPFSIWLLLFCSLSLSPLKIMNLTSIFMTSFVYFQKGNVEKQNKISCKWSKV